MQTVRIRSGATLWFPPRKLELGIAHAGSPFICFEITDGWVRARLYRSTITLASSRHVVVNPDPALNPDMGWVLRPIRYVSFETARGLVRTTTKVALRFIIKSLRLTRPRFLIAFSGRDQAGPERHRSRERRDVNVLAFEAGEHHAREGESWSMHWPSRIETFHQILLEVEDEDSFRAIIAALRQAGFTLTDESL